MNKYVRNGSTIFSADETVEWTYERPEGDIQVYARNREEAFRTIRENGFRNIKVEKLKRTGRTLAEYLEAAKQVGSIDPEHHSVNSERAMLKGKRE